MSTFCIGLHSRGIRICTHSIFQVGVKTIIQQEGSVGTILSFFACLSVSYTISYYQTSYFYPSPNRHSKLICTCGTWLDHPNVNNLKKFSIMILLAAGEG